MNDRRLFFGTYSCIILKAARSVGFVGLNNLIERRGEGLSDALHILSLSVCVLCDIAVAWQIDLINSCPWRHVSLCEHWANGHDIPTDILTFTHYVFNYVFSSLWNVQHLTNSQIQFNSHGEIVLLWSYLGYFNQGYY